MIKLIDLLNEKVDITIDTAQDMRKAGLGKAIKEVKSSIKGKENLDSWLELLSQVSFGIGTLADKVAQEPMKFE